jgi:hypothetical protein
MKRPDYYSDAWTREDERRLRALQRRALDFPSLLANSPEGEQLAALQRRKPQGIAPDQFEYPRSAWTAGPRPEGEPEVLDFQRLKRDLGL